MNSKILKNLGISIIMFYILSYLAIRIIYTEPLRENAARTIIFPENKILYYFYRPLEYIDGALTKARFHIGSHQ